MIREGRSQMAKKAKVAVEESIEKKLWAADDKMRKNIH